MFLLKLLSAVVVVSTVFSSKIKFFLIDIFPEFVMAWEMLLSISTDSDCWAINKKKTKPEIAQQNKHIRAKDSRKIKEKYFTCPTVFIIKLWIVFYEHFGFLADLIISVRILKDAKKIPYQNFWADVRHLFFVKIFLLWSWRFQNIRILFHAWS